MKKLAITFLIGLVGCSGLVDDLNENPNSPTSASYDYILTGAEVGNIILQNGETARRACIFGGQFTGIDRQHLGYTQYTLTTSDFDGLWDDAYINVLRNAMVAEESALADGVTGVTIGITQVLQALTFGTAASLYGDIPFDEAGSLEFENPAYEAQSDVYAKVQSLLDEAITNLELGTGRPPSGSEIYFNGDPDAWVEVAYTLKARFYMHTKEYGLAYAAAQNGISVHANSLMAPHTTAAEGANLNYQFFAVQSRQSDLVTSDFMISLISPNAGSSPDIANYRGHAKTDETARYDYLFQTTTIGFQPNTSTDGYAAIDASNPIVSYSENELILAEAGLRSVDFATGLGHLNDFRAFMATGGYLTNAIPSDYTYDAYDAADFAGGGIENGDSIDPDDALLREILEERYVTLFGQIEVFNDTRRTLSESNVRVPVVPNTGSSLPERFLYPQSEIDRNTSTPDPIPGLFDATEINQ